MQRNTRKRKKEKFIRFVWVCIVFDVQRLKIVSTSNIGKTFSSISWQIQKKCLTKISHLLLFFCTPQNCLFHIKNIIYFYPRSICMEYSTFATKYRRLDGKEKKRKQQLFRINDYELNRDFTNDLRCKWITMSSSVWIKVTRISYQILYFFKLCCTIKDAL